MNNSDVLDSMLQRLGNRRNFSRETLLIELNAKIAELERGSFLPWFLEGIWETTLSVGTRSLDVPADFLQEIENGKLELVSASGRFLYPKKRPYEVVQAAWQNYPEGGEPFVYALWADQVHFGPEPSSAYQLILPYFKKTLEVTDTATPVSSWLAEAYNFIVYQTLVDISANNLKDNESAMTFSNLANSAYARLYKYNEARQHTNRDYNIGEDS
jgi:hypothetical protein